MYIYIYTYIISIHTHTYIYQTKHTHTLQKMQNHVEVLKMIFCCVTSLTSQHTWSYTILSRNKIRHKLVRNKTQIWSLSGVSSQTLIVRAAVLPLGVCWEQITVHFNWTIIIHDRRHDQVNMSPLTHWRGARIYCTCLGSINKVELKLQMQSFSLSFQMVALVQYCEACVNSAPVTLPEQSWGSTDATRCWWHLYVAFVCK